MATCCNFSGDPTTIRVNAEDVAHAHLQDGLDTETELGTRAKVNNLL